MKITQNVRNAVWQILDDSAEFDASSMRIIRDGCVTALKDADKTFAGNDPMRYLVGHVDELVTQDGLVLEGY